MAGLDRASGNFQYFDPVTGTRLEGETRQCIHCGYTWIYDPALSFRRKLGLVTAQPTIRGTCLKCSGLICARDNCLKTGCVPIMKQVEEAEIRGKLLVRG